MAFSVHFKWRGMEYWEIKTNVLYTFVDYDYVGLSSKWLLIMSILE